MDRGGVLTCLVAAQEPAPRCLRERRRSIQSTNQDAAISAAAPSKEEEAPADNIS